ncbi:hypothetical protein BKH42_05740 [Helicobacter sp. 13S00482-2]|uniref:hypothetical protein n=1 Tax=Helicobacter sp. 13S00482-2 TaxID=1476200 RepID=UPI000BA724CB|nr:hypothetical protein [Helicobacter sp. 13S00482-2]PAF53427.1 hypothetical protein BKH42_05740 [Helicobacter sp. 13S00482-2]
MVKQEDRDNNAAAIIGGGALGIGVCTENPIGCAIIGGVATGAAIYESLKQDSSKESISITNVNVLIGRVFIKIMQSG